MLVETCIDGLIGLIPSNDDVIITSSYYINGELRAGRVEVCYNHVRGGICHDDDWDENAASVVCQQLGFSPYGQTYTHLLFCQGWWWWVYNTYNIMHVCNLFIFVWLGCRYIRTYFNIFPNVL